jgi:hypothetical protein
MKHKWHKEIKAWADGAEIEFRYISNGKWSEWEVVDPPVFNTEEKYDYRIKPQPKEPQYLYVYDTEEGIKLGTAGSAIPIKNLNGKFKLLGAIKMEEQS